MTAADSRSMVQVLRAWLDGDEGDRNAERLAAFVIEKAISGHFGFFKLVIDLVDGPIDPESAPGRIFSNDCTLVIIGSREGAEIANAA